MEEGIVAWEIIGFGGYLILLSVFDIRTRRIPGIWLLAGGGAVFLSMGIRLWENPGGWRMLLIGWGLGALPGIVLLLLSLATGVLGAGDGCLLIMIGILAEARQSLAIVAWSFLLAGIYAGGLLLLRKAGRKQSFPFVPFIAAAYWIQLVLPLCGSCWQMISAASGGGD